MFEKYSNLSQEDLEANLIEIETQYKSILNEEKKIDKKVRKNLWFWFFLPILGLFIYQIHLNRRKENDKNYPLIKAKKEQLIYLELEIQFLKSKIASFKEVVN